MMNGNLPSVKKLEEAFPGKGQELRNIIEGKVKPETYSQVTGWVQQCHHRPSRHDMRMVALNQVLEGHGVEAVFRTSDPNRPDMEYINMGDMYITTLVYDHLTGTYKIRSAGEWIEISERAGRRYG